VRFTRLTPALAVLAAMAVVGCGRVDTSPAATTTTTTTTATPHTAVAVAPAVPTAPARPTPITGDPAQIVGRSIPADWLRLLPTSIPPGLTPSTIVQSYGYTVRYVDDLHAKEITFTDILANPPPSTSGHPVSTSRQIRGVTATYVIYDSTAPLSQRYLMWDEPGTWPTAPGGMRTNEFFLESSGLTEDQFFQVADSVRALS
jgi:hypothetical protein